MEIIYNRIFLDHDTGSHPENKRRLECLGKLKETILENGEQYLELIHTKKYIEHVKNQSVHSLPLDVDTMTSPGSYKAATYAVTAAIMASETKNFALIRPPGHHAYPSHGSGFCLFNNIAVAVQKLVNSGKRVTIIDIDGHYGDGTAYCFYNSEKVLYCSMHQYPAFPGNGFCDEIGEGNGKGFTVNVPLPPGSGDDLFIKSLEEIFIPVTEQFQPDVVAVSAGFDAHRSDPLLNLNVSANSFYMAGSLLSNKFKNIFAVLEGGYNTAVLPGCIFNFLAGINNEKIFLDEEPTRSKQAVIIEYNSRLQMLKDNLSPYWKFGRG